MKNRRHFPTAIVAALACSVLVLVSGCGRDDHAPHAHTDHVHAAKHGGVAVELGEHEFQIEFTHGDTPGTLLAYVMDGHMNEYVRIVAPNFAGTATVDGMTFPILFEATAEPATGEKIGDSSLFTARVAGLAPQSVIDLSLRALVIKGHTYENVTVRLPARVKS
jgi:hypothetical protein